MKRLAQRAESVVAGAAAIGLVWTVLAVWVAPAVTPTIPEVLSQMWADADFYVPHVMTTLGEASWGWLWGNLIALGVGTAIVMTRHSTSAFLEQFSLAVYAVPLLAIGPILQIVTPGATTKIVLATMAVFFTTTVLWTLGLRSADPAALDVVHTAGGGRWTGFRKVRRHAALPYLFAALQIAAPAAVLGAIVGEYLGGERGLGVAMIHAQSSFAVARTWGLAIVIALLVGAAYALTGLIGRAMTPWAAEGSLLAVVQFGGRTGTSRGKRILIGVASALALIGVWWGLLAAFDLSRYFARQPPDVIEFLFDGARAEERSLLFEASWQTLIDMLVGFVIGLVASVLVAATVVLWGIVDRIVTPMAIALRSLPIIAMTPLIALIFGRGLGAVTVIVGLVTFFPTLVAVSTALRSVPKAACEIVEVYGGSKARQLGTVRLPYALPALFSAARIAVPGAIGGALLAEWLATGSGLGSLMLRASSSSRFGVVWTAAVLIVAASLLAYAVVGSTERIVARRIGAEES